MAIAAAPPDFRSRALPPPPVDERDFLREQIDRKDRTIDALIERDRETNFLVRGLQEMLSPLLGPARREPPQEHHNS